MSRSSSGRVKAATRALLVLPAMVVAGSLTVPRAHAGPAVGQFELKTLEAGHGFLEFQSQNAWSHGQPDRRRAIVDGEEVYDDNTVIRQRHALEMEMGFTSFLKMRVGIEYERERLDEPGTFAEADAFNPLKLEEIGGEVIAVFIPREDDGFGLGAVVEVERPLESEEQMSVILGPIFELASGPWFAAAIPMMVHHFGGEADEDGIKDDKWDFAYAAQIAYTVSPSWTLAIEAYGTVDRVGNTGRRGEAAEVFGDHDQHRLGPLVYYRYDFGRSLRPDPVMEDDGEIETSNVTVGLGYLVGLNDNTPDGTLKFSVEVDF